MPYLKAGLLYHGSDKAASFCVLGVHEVPHGAFDQLDCILHLAVVFYFQIQLFNLRWGLHVCRT